MGELENERTIRAMIDAVNARDRAAFDACFTDDIAVNGFGTLDVRGTRAHNAMQDRLFEMMPDRREEIIWLLAKDDCVAARFKMTGTNTGPLFGMPPTGKSAEFYVNDIFFFDDAGLIEKYWTEGDMLSFMQQLGLVPGFG